MRACLAGEVLHADFSTDDDDIFKAAKWKVMDKTTVRGLFEFDQSILEKLNNAREFYLDFANDDEDSIEVRPAAACFPCGILRLARPPF